MPRVRGVGAYPDDPYYDPNRPGWVPYWIDTPTESLAKYQATSQLQAAGKIIGGAAGDVISGAVSGAVGGPTSGFNISSGLVLAVVAIGAGLYFFARMR